MTPIIIIGDPPNPEERTLNVPFTGRNGRVLDSMLQNADINREDVTLMNLTPSTKKDVARLKPNIIIAMGARPFKEYVDGSFDKMAGSIVKGRNGEKVIGVYNPDWLMKGQMRMKALGEVFLKRAKRWSYDLSVPSYEQNFYSGGTSVGEYIDLLEGLKKEGSLAFDIETRGNNLTCAGFAWSSEDAVVIPLTKSIKNYWSVSEEAELWRTVASILEDPQIEIICHNAYFECTMLARCHGVILENVFDTMVAHHEIAPEMDKKLDDIVRLYTDRPYYKDMKGWKKGDEELWEYNGLDCVSTWECRQVLGRLLDQNGKE